MTDIRSRSITFLGESLSASVPSSPDLTALSEALEQAIFDKYGDTSNDYRAEIRNKGLTLKKDNPDLARSLVNGEVDAAQVAQMTDEEMKTPAMQAEDEKLRQQGIDSSIGVDDFQTDSTTTYTQGTSRVEEEDPNIYGEAGDASMGGGGEGEFKARAQPKVGEAMRGIEFETGQ